MGSTTFKKIIDIIRSLYPGKDTIPLHEPVFSGREKHYLKDCIDSTYVSSVGQYVDRFEHEMARYTGCKKCVAVCNGTAALHIALLLAGVKPGDEVITQPLTFIATVNAIKYCYAEPVFVDIESDVPALSAEDLQDFLMGSCAINDEGSCINRTTGRRIGACIPVHTFGHAARIDKIMETCRKWNIPVIEDAAESMGSRYKGKHTGTFGSLGVLSFNGNKIITTGGGGMIMTNDEMLAGKAKYLTTQAKQDHPWEYNHDEIGYNYRLPNLNAALGVAQLNQLDDMVRKKRKLASIYQAEMARLQVRTMTESPGSESNYWLNGIFFNDPQMKNDFLAFSYDKGVMCRPAWKLMHQTSMFSRCQATDLKNAEELYNSYVSIPSSANYTMP